MPPSLTYMKSCNYQPTIEQPKRVPIDAVVFLVLPFFLGVPTPHTPVLEGLAAIDRPSRQRPHRQRDPHDPPQVRVRRHDTPVVPSDRRLPAAVLPVRACRAAPDPAENGSDYGEFSLLVISRARWSSFVIAVPGCCWDISDVEPVCTSPSSQQDGGSRC